MNGEVNCMEIYNKDLELFLNIFGYFSFAFVGLMVIGWVVVMPLAAIAALIGLMHI